MSGRMLRWIGFGSGLLALAALGAALLIQRPYTFQGSLIADPRPASDFALTTHEGVSFRLSEQHGKVVLIFFGYTFCPDVCPVTLVEYKNIRSQLGDKADQVEFLFVTVDPERDTVETLKNHLSVFDPAITGLTGSEAHLEKVYQAYGIVHEKQVVDSAVGYLVDHTARLYVVDRFGNLRLTFPFGSPVKAIVADVAHLIDEQSAPAAALSVEQGISGEK